MKRYALVISLALLFAAFLWSCQNQGSAPFGLEESIALAKKGGGGKGKALYKIEFSGDIQTDPNKPIFATLSTKSPPVC